MWTIYGWAQFVNNSRVVERDRVRKYTGSSTIYLLISDNLQKVSDIDDGP